MEEETIYDLELHEEISIHNICFVLRVPGGWIYHWINNDDFTSTFVPFNNEFEKPIKFDVPRFRKEEIEYSISVLESYLGRSKEDEDIVNDLEKALSILKSNTK